MTVTVTIDFSWTNCLRACVILCRTISQLCRACVKLEDCKCVCVVCVSVVCVSVSVCVCVCVCLLVTVVFV